MRSPFLALVFAIPAAAAAADVVTTKDGLTLEGATTKSADGSVVVATDAGDVRLAASAVASIAAGEGPRTAGKRALAAIAKDDAAAAYRLAASLESQGVSDVAREAYERVLATDADHAAARRALGFERIGDRWLTSAQAKERSGLVLWRGEWLLPAELPVRAKVARTVRVKDDPLYATMKTAATAEPALARVALDRISRATVAERLETATSLLVHGDPKVRAWACTHLAGLGDRASMRPLLQEAVRDRDASVRKAATLAMKALDPDDAPIPFVRALASDNALVVANSAQALAWLDDRRVIGYVVKRIESHGAGPASYFSDIVQHSYIADFDVEVAQSSFIADPQIGVIQEGVVAPLKILDVSIIETRVEQTLLNTFNSLADAGVSTRAQAVSWWKQHSGDFPGFRPLERAAAR
jgi:hypothetical protein